MPRRTPFRVVPGIAFVIGIGAPYLSWRNRRPRSQFGEAKTLAFSPDGSRLATAAQGPADKGATYGAIALWDVKTGERLRLIDANASREVIDLKFSPDGQTLISAGDAVNIWEVSTGTLLRTLAIPGATWGIDVSPDGRTLAWTGAKRLVRRGKTRLRQLGRWRTVRSPASPQAAKRGCNVIQGSHRPGTASGRRGGGSRNEIPR